jgi:hypothetical protein
MMNQDPVYQEAKKFNKMITKKLFENKNVVYRDITYQEAEEDIDYMVQINLLIQTMIERRNSRIVLNN